MNFISKLLEKIVKRQYYLSILATESLVLLPHVKITLTMHFSAKVEETENRKTKAELDVSFFFLELIPRQCQNLHYFLLSETGEIRVIIFI